MVVKGVLALDIMFLSTSGVLFSTHEQAGGPGGSEFSTVPTSADPQPLFVWEKPNGVVLLTTSLMPLMWTKTAFHYPMHL